MSTEIVTYIPYWDKSCMDYRSNSSDDHVCFVDVTTSEAGQNLVFEWKDEFV
ncbi:hypothetical protein TREMEDRAFT_56297 [Tremella mesenterica DSM 1558]|uniref:uncharacterized protein n=1 Tax=Tremella mesenterica (strain ATCC 24925 / CBS 8224 / DSM 1558 / NBRC 9311 / NRRL Y-6157 / RJB 2259-6 / UBC 559-6) TaxID=578456 RepID=UPI0003F493D2|nr:uncharacterized protein TREMEDRAFT_56297 [Tremella mesenterica DSM 1558]EIW71031.1 hypothetical protein TREMEDRAFT_56297 [Tremella mesenterica DSM 1558]